MRKQMPQRALAAVTHPVSLLAVLILVLNDAWWKTAYPSWWTGKISDMAMMIIAPLLAVFLLTWVVPERWLTWVPIWGGSLPVIVFAVGKTIPAANVFIFNFMTRLWPIPIHFVYDPTDLISLVFLPVTVFIWRYAGQQAQKTAWRWVLVPVLLFSALGDAAAPDYGISCIYADEQGLWAQADYYNFTKYRSADGGVTWSAVDDPEANYDDVCQVSDNKPGETIDFTDRDGLIYRFVVGEKILLSNNNGQTWEETLLLTQLSQAEKAYRSRQQSSIHFVPGPLSIVQDAGSGNIIAGMGQEGILVHRYQEDDWVWVAVDDYGHFEALSEAGLTGVLGLISAEVFLSVYLGIFMISLLNLSSNRRWWRITKVVLAFLGWSIIVLMSPAIADTYITSTIWVIGIPAAGLWALICLVDDIVSWFKNPKTSWVLIVMLGFITSFISALVYLAWGLNDIKQYTTSVIIVFLLSLIIGFGGTIWARTRNRVEEEDYANP